MSERDEGPEPIPPAPREEIARIIRRAFEAGRQASRHYQTTRMTETALEPIEADALRVLVPLILADGGGSSVAGVEPHD